ncbi:MAG: GAF domain-containing protein [Polyangiaceae bacterium]
MSSSEAHSALEVLVDLTRSLVGPSSLERSLQLVCDSALAAVPAARHASIRLFDSSRNYLLSGARAGQGADAAPITFRPGEGVVGWVARHGMLAFVEDTATDPRFRNGGRQGFAIGSMIVAPIGSGNGTIGALGVSSPEPRAFGEHDDAIVQLLANCAVPTIERSRQDRMSYVDPVTMAFTSSYLETRLTEELSRAAISRRPFTLMLLGLRANGRLLTPSTAAARDRVRATVASRIREVLHPSCVVVERRPGSFVLVLPGVSSIDADTFGARLGHHIEKDPIDAGREPSSGASVLVVPETVIRHTSSMSGDDPSSILARAERAPVVLDRGRLRAHAMVAHLLTLNGAAPLHRSCEEVVGSLASRLYAPRRHVVLVQLVRATG